MEFFKKQNELPVPVSISYCEKDFNNNLKNLVNVMLRSALWRYIVWTRVLKYIVLVKVRLFCLFFYNSIFYLLQLYFF